jgi:hypothetical protein
VRCGRIYYLCLHTGRVQEVPSGEGRQAGLLELSREAGEGKGSRSRRSGVGLSGKPGMPEPRSTAAQEARGLRVEEGGESGRPVASSTGLLEPAAAVGAGLVGGSPEDGEEQR